MSGILRSIVAVDPGKATGLAYFLRVSASEVRVETETVFEWREVSGRVREIDPDIIHAEEFRVTSATASKSAAPWSLKCYGALETLAFETETPFTHAPSNVKDTVRDAHLKAAGLWDGKTAHERDACRHLIYQLARLNDPWAHSVLLKETK